MSDGNSTYPLDPMDKQNSKGHFQVHWIHWIQWTLSFGYLNGLVSTWCHPYAFHYVIQRHGNWRNGKGNVRWKFHWSIGSNGHAKDQWTIRDPFDKRNVQWPFHFPSDMLLRYWTLILFLWFRMWFTRGGKNGGYRDGVLTLGNGKLLSNFGHIISRIELGTLRA
jgi:hypothetical protein